MKYGIFSDPHNHAWTTFAETTADGRNSRLVATLAEFDRMCNEVQAAGGKTIVCAGDIFHTRGSIDPEVLNPVRAAFKRANDNDLDILVIPGNHDLKSRDTRALSSAVENLKYASLGGGQTSVFNEPTLVALDDHNNVAFVPWCETTAQLLVSIESLSKHSHFDPAHTDLFIHAGIDGVLSGVPAHGLTAAQLATYGYRRVFAGHYHNHRDMGQGVYSIGSLTHQTWGDVGTKAGFLIVDETTVNFRASHAPAFIDVSGMTEDEIALTAPGNFVRFRGDPMSQSEIADLREALRKMGAKGISIEVPRKVANARAAAPVKALTLDQSVDGFVGAMNLPGHVDRAKVAKRAAEHLAASRAVTEEA